MPLSPFLRERWRRAFEAALAACDAIALVVVGAWWWRGADLNDASKVGQALAFTVVALAGAAGLFGQFSYEGRLRLILLSGLIWVVVGGVTLAYGFSAFPFVVRFHEQSYPTTLGGFVFVAVGLASIATYRSRVRSRRAPVT